MTDSFSAPLALEIVAHCPVPVLVLDPRGRVRACNRAFRRLVGSEPSADEPGNGDRPEDGHPLQALLEARAGETVGWTDHHGRQYHFDVHCVDLPGAEQGQVRYLVDVSRQVELQRSRDTLSEKLEQQSLTDTLTGLLNQRGTLLALEPQVARSRRYNNPMSVIMLDARFLQEHEGAPLKAAQMLKDQLRWADLIGCTEHGEFILVLPETGTEPARQLAAKLVQGLQQIIGESPAARQASACFGITSWRRNDNATTLLRRASLALSQARSGQDERAVAL